MTVVAAALIDAEGRVLLQQRSVGRHMAGLWEFPGGKVEEEEGLEAALVRELEEELGIQLRPEDLEPAAFARAPVGGREMLLLLYICRRWVGTPRALDAAALKWAMPGDMDADEMPPADRPLIERLESILGSAARSSIA